MKEILSVAEQSVAIKRIVDQGSWVHVQDDDLEACLIEQLELALVALSSYRGRLCGAHRRVERLLRDERSEQMRRRVTAIPRLTEAVSDNDYGYGKGRYMGD